MKESPEILGRATFKKGGIKYPQEIIGTISARQLLHISEEDANCESKEENAEALLTFLSQAHGVEGIDRLLVVGFESHTITDGDRGTRKIWMKIGRRASMGTMR